MPTIEHVKLRKKKNPKLTTQTKKKRRNFNLKKISSDCLIEVKYIIEIGKHNVLEYCQYERKFNSKVYFVINYIN